MSANSSNYSVCILGTVDSEWENVVMVFLSSVIGLLALTGNTLILFVFKTSRRMKNTTDILIANLAIADILFTVIAIPKHIAGFQIGQARWVFSGTYAVVMCKCTAFLQDLAVLVSVLTIMLITIDRFIAISQPFRGYTLQQRTCAILVCLTWVIGVCVHGVYIKTFSLIHDDSPYPECTITDWDQHTKNMYFIALSLCLAIGPMCFISVVYTIIFFNLRRQQRRIGISLSDPQNVQRSLRQRKILYLSFAIVLSFVVCWAPLNLFTFMAMFQLGSIDHCTLLFEFGMFAAHSSAAVNPIITFMFSSKFRSALREVLRRWKRKQQAFKSTNTTNIELQILN